MTLAFFTRSSHRTLRFSKSVWFSTRNLWPEEETMVCECMCPFCTGTPGPGSGKVKQNVETRSQSSPCAIPITILARTLHVDKYVHTSESSSSGREDIIRGRRNI